MASQARHKLVSPKELCASRNVVPRGEGETYLAQRELKHVVAGYRRWTQWLEQSKMAASDAVMKRNF